jgi:hypothetical protein
MAARLTNAIMSQPDKKSSECDYPRKKENPEIRV